MGDDLAGMAAVSTGFLAALAVFASPCAASPTFSAEYPFEGDDFLRGSMEISPGYWLFGSVPSSGNGDSRIVIVDSSGAVLLDSLPSCMSYTACLSPGGSIVSSYSQDGTPVVRMDSQSGAPVWLRQYPEYSGYLPAAIHPRPGGGFLAVMGDSSGTLVMGLHPEGDIDWEKVISSSTPTAVSTAPGGVVLVSLLVADGSAVSILDPDGEQIGGFDCPGIILRDLEPFHGFIALAACESGVTLCDYSGLQEWQYAPSGSEVFGLVISGSRLAATGSIMEGPVRRSFLAMLDADGEAVWERSYGYGDSFRSIALSSCLDGGLCSVGGYDEGSSLGSFAIRTDSLGLVSPQGVEEQESAPGPAGLSASCNPFSATIWITCTGGSPPELVLFDCSGRLVKSLPPEDDGRFLWDGSDRSGREVPAGVYLARPSSESASPALLLIRL